jgi:hypothetical protein
LATLPIFVFILDQTAVKDLLDRLRIQARSRAPPPGSQEATFRRMDS